MEIIRIERENDGLPFRTSTIKSIFLVIFLTWSKLATVMIGTYWSLRERSQLD